jgi:hypothetical protein
MGSVGYYPTLRTSWPLLWRDNHDGYAQAYDKNNKPAAHGLAKVPPGSLVT